MSNSMLLHELNWVTPVTSGYVRLTRAELPGGYWIVKGGNGTYHIVHYDLEGPKWLNVDPITAQSVVFFLEANPSGEESDQPI
jgi:hypothetical protein